ncbi:hypothetical protein BSKO_07023 [Bryopsis sp. KO-2023]|nr:hypothetical protein BSKO_07023 [Bryopsis sp. KO-2023]
MDESGRPDRMPAIESSGAENSGESQGSRLWRRARDQTTSTAILRTFRTLRDMSGDCYIPPESLAYVRPIGNGGFAEVTLCEYAAPWGEPMPVAVKRMKPTLLGCRRDVEKFVQEANLWRKLSHPYIVDCLGVGEGEFDTDENEENVETLAEDRNRSINEDDIAYGGNWYIVQEYMTAGTLKSVITEQMENCSVQTYSDSSALSWLTQIAKGLAYLHGANPRIIHRDLKLENILLKKMENGEWVAKIADFGLSALLPPTKEVSQGLQPAMSGFSDYITPLQKAASAEAAYRLSTATGSLLYMAPEVLSGDAYNEKADVFSFAVLMYELLRRSLTLAFVSFLGSSRDVEIYAFNVMGGFRPPIPKTWPQQLKDLITDCWAPTPSSRPSMEQVCNRLNNIRGLPEWESDSLGLMENSEGGQGYCGPSPQHHIEIESEDSGARMEEYLEAQVDLSGKEGERKSVETISSTESMDTGKDVFFGCFCFQHRVKRGQL